MEWGKKDTGHQQPANANKRKQLNENLDRNRMNKYKCFIAYFFFSSIGDCNNIELS